MADRDYVFVEDLEEDLICFICMKVLDKPQLVNCCEKRFCESCLLKWKAINSSCPHCRSTDFSHMLLKRQSSKIGELKVYCANKQHGCRSILKITEYEGHLSLFNAKGCQYVKLSCENRCGSMIFRGNMDQHLIEECPNRSSQCIYCKTIGTYHSIVGPHIEKCPMYPLLCPQGCTAKVLRKELEAHKSSCPLEPMTCPFSDLGCETKVTRKDLEKHVESNMSHHMTQLAKSHMTLKAEHTALKESHEDVCGKLRSAASLIKRVVPNDQNATVVNQLQVLLERTSTVSYGQHVSLELCDLDYGYRYLILDGCKFKIEWKMDNEPVSPNPQTSPTNPQPKPTNPRPTPRSHQATPQMTPSIQVIPFSCPYSCVQNCQPVHPSLPIKKFPVSRTLTTPLQAKTTDLRARKENRSMSGSFKYSHVVPSGSSTVHSPDPLHVQIKLYLVEVFHNCPVSALKFRCTCSIKSSDYNTSVQRNSFWSSFYDDALVVSKGSANKGLCEFLICCDDMELKSPLKLLGSEVIELEMSKNFTLDICFLHHTKPRDQLQQKLCKCECHGVSIPLKVKKARKKVFKIQQQL